MSHDIEVAREILRQLGGATFQLMTGCHNLVANANGLGGITMRLPHGKTDKGAVNYLSITLDPSDTYIVESAFIRGTHISPRESFTDIYVDQLIDTVERATGLVCHMPHIRMSHTQGL